MPAGRVLLALALIVVGIGAARWWPRTVDDAYITFRYADNLVAGHGPVFNPGERVEGCSSPLWMTGSALLIAIGLDPVAGSKSGGLLASWVLVGLCYRTVRRSGVSAAGAGVAALLLGSSLVLQIWSVAGMETNAYALLVFAGLVALTQGPLTRRAALVASLALVAAASTRPEGVGLWVLGSLVPWVAGERRLRAGSAYLLPGAILAGYVLWRLGFYGDWWPNTYYAKTGGGVAMWKQGLDGLRLFVTHPAHAPWLVAAAIGGALALRSAGHVRQVLVHGAAVGAHLLWIVSVGDDGLRVHRFYVPVLAPLATLSGFVFLPALERRFDRALARSAMALAAIAIVVSLSTFHLRMVPEMRRALDYQRGNIALGRHLADHYPGESIAVAAAGAIPYYSGAPTIDMYGLNDAHIARRPFAADQPGRMMKWDNAYVLARRPRFIVINRGYLAPGDRLAERVLRDPRLLAVSALDRDLFRRVVSDGGYVPRLLELDGGAGFVVFERRPGRERR
ncbi:MAG TPA: hypothetical protein VD788_18100 [Candidatus Polarisedimenticolaceae bacterium]|nr:hypothetical protein [Candidatus Polarisedimenticolaceae bacterium]